MGRRTSGSWHDSPCGEVGGPDDHPLGLRVGSGVLELSDVAVDRLGHMEPPAAASTVRCRQILVELLGPLGPAATGWADRLVTEFGSLAAALAAAPAAQARVVGDSSAVRYLG